MTSVPDFRSDAQLRAIVDGMAAALIVVGDGGRFIDANRAATDLLGYSRDEILGMRVGDLAAVRPPPPIELARRLERRPERIEWLLRRKDGATVPIEAVMSAVDLPTGRVYLGVITDITERREIEEALRDSEARLHSIVETSPDLICVLDAEGRYRFVNSAYERALGYTPEQLIDRQTYDFIHPADRDAVAERFRGLLVERQVGGAGREDAGELDFICRTRHADGRWLDMEAKWQVLTNAAGDFTGVLVISRDVTERVRAEAALRESEERFRAVVQNAADVVAIADEEGLVRYVSPGVERMLGFRPEEILGASGYDWIEPEDLPLVAGAFERAKRAPGAQETLEFRARHRDGSARRVRAVWTNLLHLPSIAGVVVNGHDITERVELEQQLMHQAFHDPLTGLPNRALLIDRLEHALARARRRSALLGVLLLDLDRFKVVNDSLGHAAGDDLLVQLAERLGAAVDPSDTLARLGGDEFTVLVEDIGGPADATALAERLLERVRAPFALAGRTVHVTASIGVVIGGAATTGQADLLREAEVALYEAKAAGKDRVVRFAPHMDHVARRLDLESDLRRAIERGELGIHYQPIVDLASGTVVGVEALARWEHPQRGTIEPGEFIPIAEETGLVVELWQWLVREAGGHARDWQALRPQGPPLVLSVNISASHFRRPDLPGQVRRALAAAGLEPTLLRLEITEHALMRDADATLTTVRALKRLGVEVAIDDFGTGYSSLSYLRRFPVDVLKVDQSFTAELGTDVATAAIVAAICQLGRALGATVIVEGVETAAQVAVARSLTAHHAQGYHFAPPLPRERIAPLMAEGHYAGMMNDE